MNNDDGFQDIYDWYITTTFWQRKRDAVMERDGNTCAYCGNTASQVHHLTYQRFLDEELDDLVAICASCHSDIHDYPR